MSCENPLSIPNPRYKNAEDRRFWYDYYFGTYGVGLPDEYIQVPCGKCYACRKSRATAWRIRLLSEYNRYPNSIFITLTFNEQNLKRFRYVPNRAVRLFLDRMRKEFGKQVRHFIIGEYGDKTSRFHYHGILFNIPKDLDDDKLAKLWKYGFVYIGWCNVATVHYILKYITKIDPKTNKQLKIPRLIVSKGLGENFVEDYKNEPMKQNLYPFITYKNGAKVPVPRYLKDKLFDEDEKCMMRILSKERPFEKYINGKKFTDPVAYQQALSQLFANNVASGLSERVERKKPVNSIQPITPLSVRPIEPYSLDFYTNRELEVLKSDFSIEKTPF